MSFNIVRICPRCGTDIAPERHSHSQGHGPGVTVCDCGWYDPSSEAQNKKVVETKTIYVLVMATAALLVFYMHAANWGTYTFSIPVLRLEQASGLLSANGYNELADACISVGKWSCAENAYEQAYYKSQNPANLFKLAHFEGRLGKVSDASKAFAMYVKAGGKDGLALLEYAKILELNKQDADAIKMYEASVAARPDSLPIQAVSGIVRIMIKQGRYREALSRITAFHESAGNAKGYLNTELAQLKGIMRAKVVRTTASKTGV